jgi:simple sugar transport system permease protein
MTGLSVGFAFKTGLFNIGAEGQFMMGSLWATAFALWFPMPKAIHLPVVILAGALGGAIWGAIPGLLKAKFKVHEVVATIMMNHTAFHFNNYFISKVLGTTDSVKTAEFPESAVLSDKFLESITKGSHLNWGFIIVILAIVAYWFIINKTSFGYSLRAVGFNKDAAQYAGMKVDRNIILSMAIAGAFAGLGGTVLTLGDFDYGRVLPMSEGYGFDGIAIALVGANSAIGILLSGGLFAMLKKSAPLMQSAGIPKEIGGIIQAAIVLFVAMSNGIKFLLNKIQAMKAKSKTVVGLDEIEELNVPDDEAPPAEGGKDDGEVSK